MVVCCAWCPTVISEGTGKQGLSHGICPSCMNKHFPEEWYLYTVHKEWDSYLQEVMEWK